MFRSFGLLFLVSLLIPFYARAGEVDDEFQFASGLIELGFPDYAQKVVDAVVRTHPDEARRAQVTKAEGLISQRKFGDAEDLLKALPPDDPKADAIRLALANGYFRVGDVDKAKALFNEFFARFKQVPTDADLLRNYRESAYRFAKMLEQANDLPGAIGAYDRLLATNPEKDVMLRVKAEEAQAYLNLARIDAGKKEEYLNKASKLCDDVFWGGPTIFFGQAIVTKANVSVLRGDRAGAQKTIADYMDMLREIDNLLKEQGATGESPMAAVRFLKGELLQQDAEAAEKDPAKKDEALKLYAQAAGEFFNVFVQYGDSDVGPEAGVRANNLKELVKQKFGRELKIDLGEQEGKAAQTQLRLGYNLFRNKQYADAARELLKAINMFPQAAPCVQALGSLGTAYAEQNDELMVRMVVDYLGERFANNTNAATALLSIGKYYLDRSNAPMYELVYNTFVNGNPSNALAGSVLYTLAAFKKKAGDQRGADAYLERIVREYPKDSNYPKSVSQLAWSQYAVSNYIKAGEFFALYIKETTPSPDQAAAQFSLGDCLLRQRLYVEAAAEFEKVMSWLAPKDNPYSTTPEGAAKNREILERAVFQRASCYMNAKEPKDQISVFREKALKGFEQFLQLFPNSDFASKALNGKGRLQLELGNKDAAVGTFEELAKKYPATDEGKNALYTQAGAALEIGNVSMAKDAFDKMVAAGAAYKPDEFVRVGQLFLDKGAYEQAVQAFEQAQKNTQERALLERALFGIGKANYELKRYEDAIRGMESLMKEYPKSGLFYDAKFILGEAYSEVGRSQEAIAAIGDVLRYTNDEGLRTRASYTLGGIQRKAGQLQEALASVQRVALLTDPDHLDTRPLVEQSVLDAISIATELGRWKDVQDSCDQYIKLFPNSDKVSEIRKIKSDATLKSGGGAAAPAPAPPATPAAAP